MSMSDIQKEIKEALEKATDNGMWNADKEPWPGNENLQYWISSQMDGIACAVTIEDAHLIANAPTWLLYQQELIEQLTEERDRWEASKKRWEKQALLSNGEITQKDRIIEQKDAEIARLTAALRFYNNESNYNQNEDAQNPEILYDRGALARSVLSQQTGAST